MAALVGEVRYVNLPEVLENSEKEYSDRAENGVDLNNSWVGVMGVVGVSRSLYEEKDISTESPGADHDGVAGMFWSQSGSGEKTPEGSSNTMASLSSCCASVCVCMHLNSLRGSLWKLHAATQSEQFKEAIRACGVPKRKIIRHNHIPKTADIRSNPHRQGTKGKPITREKTGTMRQTSPRKHHQRAQGPGKKKTAFMKMHGVRTLTGFKKMWIGSTPATSPMGAWAATLPSAIADRNAFSAGPTLYEAGRSAMVRVLLMCSGADVPAQNTRKFTTAFGDPAKKKNTKRGARHTGAQRKQTAHAIHSLILLYDPMGSVPDLYMHV